MNINEFKQHLNHIHGKLDDDPGTKQMYSRIRREAYPSDMKEYKPNEKKDKSTIEPTTAAGDSLRPNSKTDENDSAPVKEDTNNESVELNEQFAYEYFNEYFNGGLTEDTSDEDIMEAVDCLVELCDAVCESVGLSEAKVPYRPSEPALRGAPRSTPVRTSPPGKPNIVHPAQSVVGGETPYIARGLDSKTWATDIPAKYAKSTTRIRTLKPTPAKGISQSGKKATDEPLVKTGQGSYEKVIRPSDLRK